MSNLSKRDRTLLFAIVGIGLLLGLYWMWVKPAKAALSTKTAEYTTVQDETQALQAEEARLVGLAGERSKAESRRLSVSKPLPLGVQIPSLMIELQSAADRANVKLDAVRPASVTQFGQLRAQEITVEVSGAFFDVDDFMYRVHRLVEVDTKGRLTVRGRVLLTKKFAIAPDTTASTGATAGTALKPGDRLKATFTIVAPYRFNGTETASAGAAASTSTGTTPSAPTSGSAAPADTGGEGAAPEGTNP